MDLDPKVVRRYNATVERALALFDANSEWADHIAFLSRLLKSLETGRPEGLRDIPSKGKIALCLSRCLQPTLPSGVHQKALDVYNEVFAIIDPEWLGRDLPLYLPGLSHALAFANLSTRPMVLNIYEAHLLKLRAKSLRPALKALILSLLPVIEEETSEDFERCLHTFDSLRRRFTEEEQEYFFWQTLFIASVSNQPRRAGVLVYLNHYLPKLPPRQPHPQQLAPEETSSSMVTTPEPGLLLRCFATGLRDEQALVQRGFLDLLVTHLPLNSSVLQAAAYRKDLDVLVSAALTVVLRRDMSLNRRLWSWFLGPEQGNNVVQVTSPTEVGTDKIAPDSEYFTNFGLASVIRGVHSMAEVATKASGPRTLPFRIMLSLMDRWEIGGPVVKAMFSTLMERLLAYQSTAPSQGAFDEVFRSANVFFDAIESATLFDCISELLQSGKFDLVSFIVGNFNVDQTGTSHLQVARLGCQVANLILGQVSQRLLLVSLLDDLVGIIAPTTLTTPSAERSVVAKQLLTNVTKTLQTILEGPEDGLLLQTLCSCFERAVLFSSDLSPVFDARLFDTVQASVTQATAADPQSFMVIDADCKILSSLLQQYKTLPASVQVEILECLPNVVHQLWLFLSTHTPQYHITVVESLWRLHDLTAEFDLVESTILSLLNNASITSNESKVQQIERFSTFYHHTKTVKRTADDLVPHMLRRTCLRIIDETSGDERSEAGVQWLASLHHMSPIFKLVFDTQLNEPLNKVLALQRIQKLVKILALSEDHWRSFSTSPDIQLVYAFCLKLVDSKDKDYASLPHDAFVLLRTLYDNRSGNTPPEDFVTFLVERLDGQTSDLQHQEVLETLLAILNEKSLLPSALVKVLLQGFPTIPADERLDKWITLLCNFLPNHAAFLPNLLKVTSGFCDRIKQIFESLQATFSQQSDAATAKSPEKSIANLLSGLEYVLARAHQLVFHNRMPNGQQVNGTSQELVSSRSRANDRLTVILCMQDAVRICSKLWAWKSTVRSTVASDVKSFQYTSTKLRSRSRKILENLIEAEPQECLETLIGLWTDKEQNGVLDLLQTLNGARPRSMMPAIFNAIYSRSNPNVLSSSQKSSLSIQIGSIELVLFLNEYTYTLEDDMLEEIWTDCATFLREVLANPMPHRQILIRLLRFCGILARKMENTNFSEETRMYRELADICARLFTAIFTIKPAGFDSAASRNSLADRGTTSKETKEARGQEDGMSTVLTATLPEFGPLLSQYDRSSTVFAGIASHIVTPAFHARTFPQNMTIEVLKIMQFMPPSIKTWKKDLVDAFSNVKFFESPLDLVAEGWIPLMKQLQIADKTVIGESLNRLAPPAAAGIMLGIGANAARVEADRRTQLELRRIAFLLLAGDYDAGLIHFPLIMQKIEELLTATSESSPSLATRSEVYILLRALLLKMSHINLSHLWPIVDHELRQLCDDILAGSESRYTPSSKMQGAKLLDLLLLMRPDEFQLHEWLFVTDTIDAIYPVSTAEPSSYADKLAAALPTGGESVDTQSHAPRTLKRPWLYENWSREVKDVDGLLARFFGQLSIRAFEDLYSLQPLDEDACREDLLADIFNDTAA